MDENLVCSFQILKPSTRSTRARARNSIAASSAATAGGPMNGNNQDGRLLTNKF